MHNQFANAFYSSKEWKHCRAEYREAKGKLCERCLAKGVISAGVEVHHKIRLTKENLKDPSVTLNWDNLELLCEDCHREEHPRGGPMRTDMYGHVDL